MLLCLVMVSAITSWSCVSKILTYFSSFRYERKSIQQDKDIYRILNDLLSTQQAAAVGASLKDYPIQAIFASNLLRATWTAQQIHRQQPDPKPPLTLSPLLQEQHFGKAERQPWTGTAGGKGFFRQPGRDFKFQNGESLNDVRVRAEKA
jgi:broad specificity phosphatase PhoE